MPLYEYECDACGKRFERIQKFSDPPVDVCPACGKGPVKKLLSSPAIQFKGSGWYITDYAKKGTPDSSTTASGSKSGPSDGSPAASGTGDAGGSSSESKPAATSATDKKS
jgi:putative FmdB family regulatory protein